MNGDRFERIVASREPWTDEISIRYGIQTEGVGLQVAQIASMQAIKPGDVAPPFFTLSNHAAQLLMDSLWHCGLRPSEGTGSAGAMAATERHLRDLQRLVFKEKK